MYTVLYETFLFCHQYVGLVRTPAITYTTETSLDLFSRYIFPSVLYFVVILCNILYNRSLNPCLFYFSILLSTLCVKLVFCLFHYIVL